MLLYQRDPLVRSNNLCAEHVVPSLDVTGAGEPGVGRHREKDIVANVKYFVRSIELERAIKGIAVAGKRTGL